MIKCLLCGKEYQDRRAFNMHVQRWHIEDYKRCGDLTKLGDNVPKAKGYYIKKIQPVVFQKPKGFRLLNSSDPQEAEAIKQGYMYIDSEQNIYTLEEAKKENWI